MRHPSVDESRTNIEQVRICRADLRDAVQAMDILLQSFRSRSLDSIDDRLDALKTWCEAARINAAWLESLTEPKED